MEFLDLKEQKFFTFKEFFGGEFVENMETCMETCLFQLRQG